MDEASLLRERIQMDTCKIGSGMYQCTAVDDYSRYMVMKLYPRPRGLYASIFRRSSGRNAISHSAYYGRPGIKALCRKRPEKTHGVPIQFRPNKPRSPHRNGKVERLQETDRVEFDALNDSTYEQLTETECWQTTYLLPQATLIIRRKSPTHKVSELHKTPYSDEAFYAYEVSRKIFQVADDKIDLRVQQLKRVYGISTDKNSFQICYFLEFSFH